MDLDYQAEVDGVLGFDWNPKEDFNVITMMRQGGFIDHEVISFYTNTKGKKSYVKFGSMDINALKNGASILATRNDSSWGINVDQNNVFVGSVKI